jgi:hypothetical protein
MTEHPPTKIEETIMTHPMTTDKVRESRLRRKAASFDLRLTKSRRRDHDALDYGLYGLILNSCNGLINPALIGQYIHSWTLDEVEQYLTPDE